MGKPEVCATDYCKVNCRLPLPPAGTSSVNPEFSGLANFAGSSTDGFGEGASAGNDPSPSSTGSSGITETLCVPGTAPSSSEFVPSTKWPSASVTPEAGRGLWIGCSVIRKPDKGCPFQVATHRSSLVLAAMTPAVGHPPLGRRRHKRRAGGL